MFHAVGHDGLAAGGGHSGGSLAGFFWDDLSPEERADLRTWPAAEKPRDLFAAKEGGFGITLIRDRATRIEYERIGTVNRLSITCSAGTGQQDTLYRRIARLGARISQRR